MEEHYKKYYRECLYHNKGRLEDEFEEESIDEDNILNSESEEDNEVHMDLDEY